MLTGRLSEQPIVTKGKDCYVVMPKMKGFKDAEPPTPFDAPSFFWSDDREFFNPGLDSSSGLGNPITEYGISDGFCLETGAESNVS
jgi:hypothetical protein